MSTKDERRASSGAMLRNYRDAYREKYGALCNMTDNELFDLVDGAPVLSTSEEQDEYIMELMHNFEQDTIRALANAPQDHTFPGKRGDYILGEGGGTILMREIYEIVVDTLRHHHIDKEAIAQAVCVEIERKLMIFPNIAPATYETET